MRANVDGENAGPGPREGHQGERYPRVRVVASLTA